MKGTKFKLISLILATVLVISCFAVAGTAVNAATSSAGEVVYFDNSVTNWSSVNCYMWSEGSGNNGEWPGQPMTKVEGDIWAYSITGSYDKVIFSNGVQSGDLTYEGNGKIAKPTGTGNEFTVTWSDYNGDATVPTPATQPPATTPVGGDYSVYCQNDAGWASVYCYMWTDGSGNNATWPGVKMTDIGDGIWELNYSKNYANVIFNNGGGDQTGNMAFKDGNNLYNNKTNAWEVYSSSPVKITALETDIKSPAYTSCAIKISANAKSNEGGSLSYTFKVKSAATGEQVISQGASSAVSWTPTVAGEYTISVDVADTHGNTNTRSIKFVINDATLLETAFIKAFTNSLNTTKQIKLNTPVTFTMDALGGHTGNGLLFYKFEITDPQGTANTAYYTTKNTFSYTPTKQGVYSVKAYVQNSYNNTVNQTYNYNCVTTINENVDTTIPTAPPQPSTTKPVVPTTAPISQPATTKPVVPTTNPAPTTSPQPTGATPKLGDANGDGKVNINDVTMIQKHLAGISVNIDLSQCDTDRSGDISIKDATVIQKYLCGILTTI